MATQKYRVYVRIAKSGRNGYLVKADKNQKFEPLFSGYHSKNYKPTVVVALDLEIDDKEFDLAKNLINVKIEKPQPAITINEEESVMKNDIK